MGQIVLTFTCPKCGAVFGWEVDYEPYVVAIEKDKLMEAKCYSCGHILKYSPKRIKEANMAANNKKQQESKKGFFSRLFKR